MTRHYTAKYLETACKFDGIQILHHPKCDMCGILIGAKHREKEMYPFDVGIRVKREIIHRRINLCGSCSMDYDPSTTIDVKELAYY